VYLQSLVLILCILYSSVFVFGKLALNYSPPFFLTAARMLLAGLLLLAYQYGTNRHAFKLKKEQWLPILVIAVMGVYLTNVLEFWGLQFMVSGKACFLCSFCPIATAILSCLWFNEKITTIKWIGLSLGVIGFLPLLISPAETEDLSGTFFFLSYAELAVLGSTLSTAAGWLAMRHAVKDSRLSPFMANGVSMVIGGMLSLIHSFISEPWSPTPITDFWPFLQWFLILTVVSNLICYNLHAVLLRSFTATYLAFVGLSQPFLTALLGWLFLDEILSSYFWISVLIVTVGLYLFYQQELREKEPPPPSYAD
jgi:drug/metabolite transporter (DMT)-like permease